MNFYVTTGGRDYLIATDSSTVYVAASQLTLGSIDNFSLDATDPTVRVTTPVTISFSVGTTLPGDAQIVITFPTGVANFGIAALDSCTLGAPRSNAVENPTSCSISNNVITIVGINGGSEVAKDGTIQFSLPGMSNPNAVQDVGAFAVTASVEDADGVYAIAENADIAGVYSPTAAEITGGLSVTATDMFTFTTEVDYTLQFRAKTYIEAGSLLTV